MKLWILLPAMCLAGCRASSSSTPSSTSQTAEASDTAQVRESADTGHTGSPTPTGITGTTGDTATTSSPTGDTGTVAALGIVAERQAPYANCIATGGDITITYDAYGWPTESTNTSGYGASSVTTYVRVDDMVTEATTVSTSSSGTVSTRVMVYDEHQHATELTLDTGTTYLFELTHTADLLVQIDEFEGAGPSYLRNTYVLDACENRTEWIMHAFGGPITIDYANTYATGCVLESVLATTEGDYGPEVFASYEYDALGRQSDLTYTCP